MWKIRQEFTSLQRITFNTDNNGLQYGFPMKISSFEMLIH